ncbi:hypothetical protein EOS93_29615 [Rhizobium sp. RMa-01]|nr:hypothetical protein EOS93_29615 [Rhizobium sp. RMa-01]
MDKFFSDGLFITCFILFAVISVTSNKLGSDGDGAGAGCDVSHGSDCHGGGCDGGDGGGGDGGGD